MTKILATYDIVSDPHNMLIYCNAATLANIALVIFSHVYLQILNYLTSHNHNCCQISGTWYIALFTSSPDMVAIL